MAGEEQVASEAKDRERPVDPLTRRWSDRMFMGAMAVWGLSLLLPGIHVGREFWQGWQILLIGLPAAWMGNGWAVYANIFFILSAVLTARGRLPDASLLVMFGLAATSPLFVAVPNPSTAGETPVTGWGWGFPFWLASLVLLAVAAGLRAQSIRPIVAKLTLVLLAAAFAFVVHLHLRQRSSANSLDVARYLPSGVAVARVELCDLPLTAVQGPLIAPDAVVTMQIDPLLNASEARPPLHVPQPLSFQDSDGAWLGRRSDFGTLWVRTEVGLDRPVLQARAFDGGAMLRLLESAGGRVLYEQELKLLPMPKSRSRYCPGSNLEGLAPSELGYDGMLARALNLNQATPSRSVVTDFIAQSPCSPRGLRNIGKYGTKHLFEWDGREVVSSFGMGKIGFCSDGHAVLVTLNELNVVRGGMIEIEVKGFERATLRPVAQYLSRRSCDTKESCTALAQAAVARVSVAGQKAVIETSLGELVAERR